MYKGILLNIGLFAVVLSGVWYVSELRREEINVKVKQEAELKANEEFIRGCNAGLKTGVIQGLLGALGGIPNGLSFQEDKVNEICRKIKATLPKVKSNNSEEIVPYPPQGPETDI